MKNSSYLVLSLTLILATVTAVLSSQQDGIENQLLSITEDLSAAKRSNRAEASKQAIMKSPDLSPSPKFGSETISRRQLGKDLFLKAMQEMSSRKSAQPSTVHDSDVELENKGPEFFPAILEHAVIQRFLQERANIQRLRNVGEGSVQVTTRGWDVPTAAKMAPKTKGRWQENSGHVSSFDLDFPDSPDNKFIAPFVNECGGKMFQFFFDGIKLGSKDYGSRDKFGSEFLNDVTNFLHKFFKNRNSISGFSFFKLFVSVFSKILNLSAEGYSTDLLSTVQKFKLKRSLAMKFTRDFINIIRKVFLQQFEGDINDREFFQNAFDLLYIGLGGSSEDVSFNHSVNYIFRKIDGLDWSDEHKEELKKFASDMLRFFLMRLRGKKQTEADGFTILRHLKNLAIALWKEHIKKPFPMSLNHLEKYVKTGLITNDTIDELFTAVSNIGAILLDGTYQNNPVYKAIFTPKCYNLMLESFKTELANSPVQTNSSRVAIEQMGNYNMYHMHRKLY